MSQPADFDRGYTLFEGGAGKKESGDKTSLKKESTKRKLEDGGDYDPSSPTSEASDDTPAAKKAATEGKSVSNATASILLLFASLTLT